ncbi:hypothetical protein J6590_045998 [Homalodisca vitripennis]|nr:hypothetical protein J6590_045998 [Homalodisca vitripennis]
MRLPLSNDNKIFQLYDIITYPVYDASLKVWTQWEVGTQKLLISKDRLMYSMYNQLEFDRECRGEQLIVCPLSNVLLSVSKRPNCAVEMFHYEQISEIVFPNVEEIYTSEKELFSSEQETAVKVLQGLNERLGTLGVKEYRPEDVVYHLKSHILFGRKLYAAKVAAAGSFGLVSTLMLVYMCYRFVMSVMAWRSSRRNRRRQRRSATLTEVFAKVRGLTSLDSPEGDQEGVNPGEINDVEQNVEAVEVVNLERLRDVIQAL